jgi:glycosyltransferase involved in cell wall biosynthesis
VRVGGNARLLAEPQIRGWSRYTLNLLQELSRLGVELFLYSDLPFHPEHRERLTAPNVHFREAMVGRYVRWEQVWLPRACEKDGVDLLHSPSNFGLPWSSRCPRVLTLHDAIDRVYYASRLPLSDRLRPRYLQSRLMHWYARTRADHVITVSHHSRDDLLKHLGLPRERVSVVYEAADARFHEPVAAGDRELARETYGLQRPYFFYVGGLEGRKNIPFLVRAYARAGLRDVDLALAGGSDAEAARISELASPLGVCDRIRLLGRVPDEALPALYAEALALVYPSEYEGFGLQLCEAMAVGCPVLAADATSLPEIMGEGGVTFPLDDDAVLADLLGRVAADGEFRGRLAERARWRGQDFSWARTARETVRVYEAVLAGTAPAAAGGLAAASGAVA